jgi:tetratricopeptide (TPR) repeat protein
MQEGLRIAENVIPRAEAVGDLEMLEDALSHAAETTTLSGEFDRSRVYRERQLAAQERMGDTFGMAVTIVNLSWLERCRGDWQTARAHADRALDMLRSTGTVNGVVFALHELGELALWEGDWEEASRQLEECVALAEPQGDLQFLRQAHRPLAELDLLQGRPEAALARLEPILDRPGLQEHDVTSLLPVLAWACLALGDVARATRVLTEAIDRVTTQQNRLALIDALRIKGMLLSHQQQWDKAAAAFEEAASLARSMPYPYAEARALEAHGMMAIRKVTQRVPGFEGEQGRQRLEQALAIYRRLGAKKDIERTEQALKCLIFR